MKCLKMMPYYSAENHIMLFNISYHQGLKWPWHSESLYAYLTKRTQTKGKHFNVPLNVQHSLDMIGEALKEYFEIFMKLFI